MVMLGTLGDIGEGFGDLRGMERNSRGGRAAGSIIRVRRDTEKYIGGHGGTEENVRDEGWGL